MRHLIIICLSLLFSTIARAQSNLDTLTMENGQLIIGEIKTLSKGQLTLETNYSKKDFIIKWKEVRAVASSSRFLVTLQNGMRINGTLHSGSGMDSVDVFGIERAGGGTEHHQIPITAVVGLIGLHDKVWSRFKANVDVGFNITRANSLRQFNSNTRVSYTADRWAGEVRYQLLKSTQDSTEPTRRTDAGLSASYFLPKDWFLSVGLTFLSNTEQALRLRTSGKLGGGKFITNTNRKYWSAAGGLNLNFENFSNETPSRNSLEAFAATEYNLFDIGDLSLLSQIYLYRSLTEASRWRSDFKVDMKYDLPLDFYVKLSSTINYDNQPAIVGRETDYIITFGFGWEL